MRPMRGADDREAERDEGPSHRFALRVEDARLGPHEHGRPHSTSSGSARYASNAIPVSRSNAST